MVIETARLRLRPLEDRDLDGLMAIFGDPVAMRYYPGTKSRAEGAAWLARHQELARSRGLGLWAAELAEGGAFAGQCGLVPQDVEGIEELEVGYLFVRAHWGRGLATEAAAACRDRGFGLGWPRLISLIDPANAPSIRVAERIGMAPEREVVKWGKRLRVYAIGA